MTKVSRILVFACCLAICAPVLGQGAAAVFQPLPLLPVVGGDPCENISGERMYSMVADIVEFSQQSKRDGDKMWGRVCGTKYAHRAAEYAAEKFKEIRLSDVRIDTFPTNYPQWWPTDWGVTVIGGSSAVGPDTDRALQSAVPSHPPGHDMKQGSVATPAEGIEADLVYVGLGGPGDLVGKELEGKIALLRSLPRPSAYLHTGQEAIKRLEGRGLVGLITILDIPGNLMSMSNFSALPGVPSFEIGAEDGAYLEGLIGRAGAVRPPGVRLRLVVSVHEGWEGWNALGMLPGTTDEYVVIFAHTDGWFDAAVDNASGIATMIELARHFAGKPMNERKRTMLFAATAGHHAGSPGTKYLVENYPEIMSKTALAINSEHTASVLAMRYGDNLLRTNTESPRMVLVPEGSKQLLSICAEAVERYGIVVGEQPGARYAGDAKHFRGTGIPLVSIMEASILGYHTTADTLTALKPQGLERAARAYAHILDRVDRIPRQDLRRSAR